MASVYRPKIIKNPDHPNKCYVEFYRKYFHDGSDMRSTISIDTIFEYLNSKEMSYTHSLIRKMLDLLIEPDELLVRLFKGGIGDEI